MKKSEARPMGWIFFVIALFIIGAQGWEINRLQLQYVRDMQSTTNQCVEALHDVRDHCTVAIKETGDACIASASKY